MSPSPQYLLDTNVLSETRRRKPDENVIAFLRSVEPSSLFVSALTLGELRKGVALRGLTDAPAAATLGAWVDGIELGFADRILNIDTASARLWGEWSAQRAVFFDGRSGRPLVAYRASL